MMRTPATYLYNYLFAIGLLILVLNDHILKWEYGNWFTGKLSDIAGVFVLPFFLSYFLPKKPIQAILLSAVSFIGWKLPFSEPLIRWYNEFSFIPINRVVDYTDLFALLILPISYWGLLKVEHFKFAYSPSPILMLLPCCFIFMATSWPREFNYTRSTGNFKFVQSIEIPRAPEEVLSEIERQGIEVKRDNSLISEVYNIHPSQIDRKFKEDFTYYMIDELVIKNDTVRKLQFAVRDAEEFGSILYLNSITIEKELDNEAVKIKLRKFYRELLISYFKESLLLNNR
jgi:hypothetical protein